MVIHRNFSEIQLQLLQKFNYVFSCNQLYRKFLITSYNKIWNNFFACLTIELLRWLMYKTQSADVLQRKMSQIPANSKYIK